MSTRKYGSVSEAKAAFARDEITVDEYTRIITEMVEQESAVVAASKCPVSLQQFMSEARPLTIRIGDSAGVVGTLKEFKKGSFGWNINGKATVRVGNHDVNCQVSGNIIAINSDEAPREGGVKAEPAATAKVTRTLSTPAKDGEAEEVEERAEVSHA